MAQVDKLMFTVGMVDKLSKPMRGIQKTINRVTTEAKRGFHNIQMGAVGLIASGYAISRALQPAREMYRAIGEVKSLDVAESALDELTKTALNFSVTYGESATDFVRASYDIQSAIGGLSGAELSKFTEASAILAKGTKSDVATITSYMGTMYSVYSDTAEKMGKANWVEKVSGQTAAAVKMFKTTGAEMSAAASRIGAESASAGVSMAEQMAVLGTLQGTMKGSEAGTKYSAFLAGIGKAQTALGLSFTDAQGMMLPITDVLDSIRGKFGDTLDVAESDALTKAFGTKEATSLIKLLMKDTDGLSASINKLSNIKGMKNAEEMAASMVDPFDQAGASVSAMATSFGLALLPAIQPVLTLFADMAGWLVTFTQKYPLLTKIIGGTALAIIGIGLAMSLVTIASGFGTAALAGYKLSLAALAGGMKIINIVMYAFKVVMWLVNVAMTANPIGAVIVGVAALVAAVAALIIYWEELVGWFTNLGWVKSIGSAFDWLIEKLNLIPGININTGTTAADTANTEPLATTAKTNIPAGGISQQITNAVSNQNNSHKNNITINTNQPVNAVKNEMLMQFG